MKIRQQLRAVYWMGRGGPERKECGEDVPVEIETILFHPQLFSCMGIEIVVGLFVTRG